MIFRGVPIGWRSPTGFRSPWLHEMDAEDGLGWPRSFSGMLNSCGLDHIFEHDNQRTYRLAVTPYAGTATISALEDRLRLRP